MADAGAPVKAGAGLKEEELEQAEVKDRPGTSVYAVVHGTLKDVQTFFPPGCMHSIACVVPVQVQEVPSTPGWKPRSTTVHVTAYYGQDMKNILHDFKDFLTYNLANNKFRLKDAVGHEPKEWVKHAIDRLKAEMTEKLAAVMDVAQESYYIAPLREVDAEGVNKKHAIHAFRSSSMMSNRGQGRPRASSIQLAAEDYMMRVDSAGVPVARLKRRISLAGRHAELKGFSFEATWHAELYTYPAGWKNRTVEEQVTIFTRGAVGENVFHSCILFRSPEEQKEGHRIMRYLVDTFGPRLVNASYQNRKAKTDPPFLFDGETALHIAIVNSDHKLVQFLVESGADLSARCYGSFFNSSTDPKAAYKNLCYYGEYPASFAVVMSDYKLVRYLCEMGADVLGDRDSLGNSALHLAVIHSRDKMLDFLLDEIFHLPATRRRFVLGKAANFVVEELMPLLPKNWNSGRTKKMEIVADEMMSRTWGQGSFSPADGDSGSTFEGDAAAAIANSPDGRTFTAAGSFRGGSFKRSSITSDTGGGPPVSRARRQWGIVRKQLLDQPRDHARHGSGDSGASTTSADRVVLKEAEAMFLNTDGQSEYNKKAAVKALIEWALTKNVNAEGHNVMTLAAATNNKKMFEHQMLRQRVTLWTYGPITRCRLKLDLVDTVSLQAAAARKAAKRGAEEPGAESMDSRHMSALEVVVKEGHLELLESDTLVRLLEAKWERHARGWFYFNTVLYVILLAAFTVLCTRYQTMLQLGQPCAELVRRAKHKCLRSFRLAATAAERQRPVLDLSYTAVLEVFVGIGSLYFLWIEVYGVHSALQQHAREMLARTAVHLRPITIPEVFCEDRDGPEPPPPPQPPPQLPQSHKANAPPQAAATASVAAAATVHKRPSTHAVSKEQPMTPRVGLRKMSMHSKNGGSPPDAAYSHSFAKQKSGSFHFGRAAVEEPAETESVEGGIARPSQYQRLVAFMVTSRQRLFFVWLRLLPKIVLHAFTACVLFHTCQWACRTVIFENFELALAAVAGWLYLLHFASGNEQVGKFVAGILEVLSLDLLQFVGVYFIVLAGVALALVVLIQNHKSTGFDAGFLPAILRLFRHTNGDLLFEQVSDNKANANIMLVVVVVSTICINLVLLNLLVSLINTAFESGEKIAHSKWRFRWATAILDMERLYSTNPVRHFFKVSLLGMDPGPPPESSYELGVALDYFLEDPHFREHAAADAAKKSAEEAAAKETVDAAAQADGDSVDAPAESAVAAGAQTKGLTPADRIAMDERVETLPCRICSSNCALVGSALSRAPSGYLSRSASTFSVNVLPVLSRAPSTAAAAPSPRHIAGTLRSSLRSTVEAHEPAAPPPALRTKRSAARGNFQS